MYCPRCGNIHINHFENNRPVADYFCPACESQYELKSKNGNLGRKINDGAYGTMIERITSNDNPDFFFMSYSKTELKVKDFVFIPKHFFVPEIIEKRRPLSQAARRAGWTGCNILVEKIPEQGVISIIRNGHISDMNIVINKVQISNRLEIQDIAGRSWLMDVLYCVNRLPLTMFTLADMYKYEDELKMKHPNNNNVRPKIRQQLQLLRDKGVIDFFGKW